MSDQLKPCPFCGEPPRFREDADGGILGCFPSSRGAESECSKRIMLYIGYRVGRKRKFSSPLTKADAVAAWNRRAP